MACTISISESEADVWMVRNSVFQWFARLIIERFSHDETVVSQVVLTEAMNGVSLDAVYAEEPELAIRLRDAFRDIANEIASRQCPLPNEVAATPDMAEKCRLSFAELVAILDRWDPSIS